MASEFLREAVSVPLFHDSRRYRSIAARTSCGGVVLAVRAYEDHDPESADDSVGKIADCARESVSGECMCVRYCHYAHENHRNVRNVRYGSLEL